MQFQIYNEIEKKKKKPSLCSVFPSIVNIREENTDHIIHGSNKLTGIINTFTVGAEEVNRPLTSFTHQNARFLIKKRLKYSTSYISGSHLIHKMNSNNIYLVGVNTGA